MSSFLSDCSILVIVIAVRHGSEQRERDLVQESLTRRERSLSSAPASQRHGLLERAKKGEGTVWHSLLERAEREEEIDHGAGESPIGEGEWGQVGLFNRIVTVEQAQSKKVTPVASGRSSQTGKS